MSQPLRHVLLSSVKDEGPFVLEFIAHHRVLGFDAIHMASNDCSDGTDLLLDALASQGVITHTRNRLKPGDTPQHRGYQRIRKEHPIAEADWIMVLDADEFLVVDRGARRVGDLTALAGPEVDVITLNAMNFGTSGDFGWRPGRVAEQFPDRLPTTHRRNGPVKSLSRGGGRWKNLHNHHPMGFTGPGDICHMRGNGEVSHVPNDGRLWDHLRHFKPDRITHEIAWFNHYPIKSLDSYMLRRRRGRGVTKVGAEPVERHTEEYWTIFAAAQQRDTRILDFYGDETLTEIARLRALPGIDAAQLMTEARFAAQIAAIAAEPDD
ncbi:glycosyltransferase family 2 protein [Paracoccus aurantiacus]|nr:glycosyltransferase family 2 protein [Paracoccus aurantiacus]